METVKRAGWLFVAVASIWLCSGCGAVFNGTSSTLPVTSNPSGAEVWVDGELVGRTPTQIRVSNANDHTILFRIAGGEDQTVQVRRTMSAGYLVLDVFFTGALGLIVDGATGSWYSPDRDHVHAELRQARPQQGYGPPQYGPPQYGPPQYGPPQYGPPQYGPPQQSGAPQYGPPQQFGAPPQYGPPSPSVAAAAGQASYYAGPTAAR